ncbi:MAG: galactokinase [Lachnospiraceae bacterium]|nr:galactokinase [Lachnospiraceae bacterium]
MQTQVMIKTIENGEIDDRLLDIYVDATKLAYQKERYIKAIKIFETHYGAGEAEIFSAPGRSEVGGNHTDHQHGEVLAASINLDTLGVVRETDDNLIKIISDDYDEVVISLDDIEAKEKEKETTTALIKGVIAGFVEGGHKVGGFCAYITSDVLIGAGLSSSAAFETLIGTILSGLYNDMKVSAVEIAIIGQYAENVYFGKPCGLMDQMACSVGNLVHIDFKNPKNPEVEKLDFNMSEHGYSLCITDTKGSHADLTDEYAAVPQEMKAVANYFGKEVLRDVTYADVIKEIVALRKTLGDRSVLRAVHFLCENERVVKEVNALKWGDMNLFLENVKASGDSSFKYLQNVYSNNDVENQNISIALMMSDVLLKTEGVSRVHGGGFAGTIQAFVKNDFVATYKAQMDHIFGEGACKDLRIRKYGGMKVL